jgi:hypothetical protein
MHTGSAESRDRLRQAIDDEKTSLGQFIQEQIRIIRASRNALVPISRLPPETLAAVFSYLSPPSTGHPFLSKWICFSHVCRQWRETALKYLRRWSHINFPGPAPAVESHEMSAGDIIPYVARKVYGPQGTEPEFDDTYDYDDDETEDRAEYDTCEDSDCDRNHDGGY